MARWLIDEYPNIAYEIAVRLADDSLQFGMQDRAKMWCEIAIAVEMLLTPNTVN